jgi:FeS assembly SUF system protein
MDPHSPARFPLSTLDETPAVSPGPVPELPPEATLNDRVIAVLKTVYDPEIPVNIYELGLIYDLQIDPTGAVAIKMTLTSPACPVAGALPHDVEQKVAAVPGVTKAKVDLVWDPPWEPSRMSEAAQLQLGLF